MAQATPAQAALQAQMQAQQQQEIARIEFALSKIHKAYSSVPSDNNNIHSQTPNNTANETPFQQILYDPIEQHPHIFHHLSTSATKAYLPRPTHVSSQKWSEALALNPDPNLLLPISLVGADALSTRVILQQEKAKTYKQHLSQLRNALQTLQESQVACHQRIQYYQQENEHTMHPKMLSCMKKVELLRCRNLPLQPAERELAMTLGQISKQVWSLMDHLRLVQDMAMRYRQQREAIENDMAYSSGTATASSRKPNANNGNQHLSEEDKQKLELVLEEQGIGLERIVGVVKKDLRDLEIMKKDCRNKIMYANKAL